MGINEYLIPWFKSSPNTGDQEGREAIAELFSKFQGVDISYKNAILTSGCAGAINIFLRTILSVDDEVLFQVLIS